MKKENVIEIFRGTDVWLARFIGPHVLEIRKLFGTAVLPTPLSASVGAIEALNYLRALPANAGATIRIAKNGLLGRR